MNLDIRKSGCTTDINDAGGKFALGFNDSNSKFAVSVNYTSDKFVTCCAGAVDTGEKLPPVSTTPVINLPPVSQMMATVSDLFTP
jgi:hypothetical protein